MKANLLPALGPWRDGMILRTLILAAGLAVSACGVSGSTVDGFKIGVMVECSGGTDPRAVGDSGCDLERATLALDAREPGHAAVVSYRMYSDGTQPEPIDMTGDGPPPTPGPRHPGPKVTVFVFTLADGSTRATGVACGDVKPTVCVGVPSYPN